MKPETLKQGRNILVSLFALVLLIIGVSAIRTAGFNAGLAKQTVTVESFQDKTSADATADYMALSPIMIDFKNWHDHLMQRRYGDYTYEMVDQAALLHARFAAAKTTTLVGKTVQSYFTVAALYDKMLINSVIHKIIEAKGPLSDVDKGTINSCINGTIEAKAMGEIFSEKLAAGSPGFN